MELICVNPSALSQAESAATQIGQNTEKSLNPSKTSSG
jgi:hypothetical protein